MAQVDWRTTVAAWLFAAITANQLYIMYIIGVAEEW